jgi:hypothetical protein
MSMRGQEPWGWEHTMKRKKRAEPTDREMQAMATRIVTQLIEADEQGMHYIADLLNGETTFFSLFERDFPAPVKRRVYDELRIWEQAQPFTH